MPPHVGLSVVGLVAVFSRRKGRTFARLCGFTAGQCRKRILLFSFRSTSFDRSSTCSLRFTLVFIGLALLFVREQTVSRFVQAITYNRVASARQSSCMTSSSSHSVPRVQRYIHRVGNSSASLSLHLSLFPVICLMSSLCVPHNKRSFTKAVSCANRGYLICAWDLERLFQKDLTFFLHNTQNPVGHNIQIW